MMIIRNKSAINNGHDESVLCASNRKYKTAISNKQGTCSHLLSLSLPHTLFADTSMLIFTNFFLSFFFSLVKLQRFIHEQHFCVYSFGLDKFKPATMTTTKTDEGPEKNLLTHKLYFRLLVPMMKKWGSENSAKKIYGMCMCVCDKSTFHFIHINQAAKIWKKIESLGVDDDDDDMNIFHLNQNQ